MLFRRSRYAIPVGLVVLLLAVVFMGSSSTPVDESAWVNLSEIREDVVREMYDSSGALINPDRQLQTIARDNAGGFGGYYFDDNDPSTVYVYMLDMTKVTNAETALRAALPQSSQYTRIVPVQGRYSMESLVDWFYRTLRAFDEGGVDVNGAGLRPRDNGFSFTIGSDIDEAWDLIDELGIPREAVSLRSGGEWIPLADEDNVQARWRPIVGGIQIRRMNERCTIGFTTIRDNVRGMITASHCTRNDNRIGGLDSSNFRQPDNSAEVVANETIDPNTKNLSHEQCGSHTNCRYSDAVFSQESSAADIDRGKIARPKSLGSRSVNPSGTTWSITHESYPASNRTVNYVGKDRGWREATVDTTCELVETGAARLVCSATAEVSSPHDRPQPGDSGAPVFELSGGNVKLVGIISARDPDNDDRFAFSKTGAIYTDLGLHSTWDTCASGC